MRFAWIPEAPRRPGVYAAEDGVKARNEGKIQFRRQAISTYCVDDARKFESLEDCKRWCLENPEPEFTPAEHGWMG